MRTLGLFILTATLALPAAAAADQQQELEKGFAGALRGCEEWVLNPSSWAGGPGPFLSVVGLGDKIGLVDMVEEVNLPPESLRRGARYWRINSTETAGYILVVSDQLPMCHITGGGDADLQPVAESVLASEAFASRWQRAGTNKFGGMISTTYRNREDAKLSIVVSRAEQLGQRRDRVQVLATAMYKVGD